MSGFIISKALQKEHYFDSVPTKDRVMGYYDTKMGARETDNFAEYNIPLVPIYVCSSV